MPSNSLRGSRMGVSLSMEEVVFENISVKWTVERENQSNEKFMMIGI